MSDIRFKLEIDKDFEKWLNSFNNKQRQKLLERGLAFWALKLEKKVIENVDKEGITDTGHLKKSIHITKLNNEMGYKVTAGANYAQAVEYGSRPHKLGGLNAPGGQALYKWVSRKLKPRNPYVVFLAVKRKIAKFGTRPHPYFKPAVDWLVKNSKNMVQDFAKFLGIIE